MKREADVKFTVCDLMNYIHFIGLVKERERERRVNESQRGT